MRSQGLEEEIVATVAQDVLRGLEYMHSHSMIHRDVKVGLFGTFDPDA
jgi:serine/threonine-protein kinase OSR1/STK39